MSTYFRETLSGVSFIFLFEECEHCDQPPHGQKQARKVSEDGVRQLAGGCHQSEDLTFKRSKRRELGPCPVALPKTRPSSPTSESRTAPRPMISPPHPHSIDRHPPRVPSTRSHCAALTYGPDFLARHLALLRPLLPISPRRLGISHQKQRRPASLDEPTTRPPTPFPAPHRHPRRPDTWSTIHRRHHFNAATSILPRSTAASSDHGRRE
jgi:hypothetical protein